MQLAFQGMRAPIKKSKPPGNRCSDPAHFPQGDGSIQTHLIAPTPSYRSPIAYIGGKNKAWGYIKSVLPENLNEAAAPFVGGASIELRLAANGIRVHASDNFWHLTNFWNHFLSNPKSLARRTRDIYPIDHEFAKELVLGDAFNMLTDAQKAAHFWGLNKMSWCGKTMQSFGLSADPTAHTFFEHPRWDDWRNDYITIEHRDYREAFEIHKDKFMYLDPPYVGKEHYYGKIGEQKPFDHEEFADRLKQHPGDWILSYGNHPRIWELYAEYDIIEPHWQYSSRSRGGTEKVNISAELLILKNPPSLIKQIGKSHATNTI